MFLLTSAETRLLDELSIHRYKIPARKLMENAGREVFRVIKKELGRLKRKKAAIFCGPGNNGGDGLVVARLLRKAGAKVHVFRLKSDKPDFKIPPSPPLSKGGWGGFKPDLVVDALFGTGLSRVLTGKARKWVQQLNRMKGLKVVAPLAAGAPLAVAVDIPSGLCADTGKALGAAFKADITVTFGYPKRGFFFGDAHNYVGKLHVRPIGLSPKAVKRLKPTTHLITRADIQPLLEPRLKTSHKGTYGHVFVIGCSLGKIGAGLMAAHTALKAGAGLSTLVLPHGAYRKIDPRALEIMYEPIGGGYFTPDDLPDVLAKLERATVVAIGPGLGTHPHTVHFVHQVLSHYRGPMVIDADGLNAVAQNPEILMKRRGVSQYAPTLLTPHPAEMGRLIGKSTAFVQQNRLQVAADFSRKFGVNVLLKGYRSVLSLSNGIAWINPTGNPAMASAGQGDVLTGIYAGLMAQYPVGAGLALPRARQVSPLQFGCFLHGLVGDILAVKKRVVLATDIADNLDLGYEFLHQNSEILSTVFY